MSLSERSQIFLCFLIATISLSVAMGIGRFAFTPILPLMIQEGSVYLAQTAWLSSINYIGYLVGALSLLKNSFHRFFILLGLSIVTITTWFAADSDFGWLMVLRFLAGMASAWVLVSISAWAVAWLKAKHVTTNGLIYTGVGIGITLTGLLCSYFISQQAGVHTDRALSSQLWRYLGIIAFIVTSLVAITMRLIQTLTQSQNPALSQITPLQTSQITISNLSKSETSPSSQAVQTTTHKLKLSNLLLAYGLFGFGYILPATFLPQIAKQWLTGQSYLLIWPFFGLAAALSVALTQWLQHRNQSLSLLKVWQIAQAIMAVGTLLPAIWQSLTGLMLSALMVGGTFMVVTMAGLQVATAQKLFYPNYNLSAMLTASFAFGQLLGPLTALVAKGNNIWLMLLPTSALVLLFGVFLLWQADPHKVKN